MKRYTSVVLFCLAAGCAQPTAVAPEAASDVPLRYGHAATPYSADEIRDAHPDGTHLKFMLHRPGQENVVQVMRFSDGDEQGTTVTSSAEKPDGTAIGEASSARATWVALRDHAKFEASKTVVGVSACVGPAGRFECMLYTVEGKAGTEQQFHFAKTKPGPPVLMKVMKGEQELMRMELLEYVRGTD